MKVPPPLTTYGAFFQSAVWLDLVRRAQTAPELPELETKCAIRAIKRCAEWKRLAEVASKRMRKGRRERV